MLKSLKELNSLKFEKSELEMQALLKKVTEIKKELEKSKLMPIFTRKYYSEFKSFKISSSI